MKQSNLGVVKSIDFAKKISILMTTGSIGEYRSDFTIIYGNFSCEYIEAFKEIVTEHISKISGCSTGSTAGLHRNYLWAKREDGSTGCIKMYGPDRVKGARWEGKRPGMAITAIKKGTSKIADKEIYGSVLMSLTPQNPVWLEVEIDNEAE